MNADQELLGAMLDLAERFGVAVMVSDGNESNYVTPIWKPRQQVEALVYIRLAVDACVVENDARNAKEPGAIVRYVSNRMRELEEKNGGMKLSSEFIEDEGGGS